jgi:hypothetical protein
MDGAKPPGSKVGLIDEYHMWCFLMDPFNYEWRITYGIDVFVVSADRGLVRIHVY